MPSRADALPRILLDDSTRWFLELRRRFRSLTGRELGLAHATRWLARVLPQWQELPLEGPGGHPVFLDLRNKEGYLSAGFRNTVGHMGPLLALARDGDVVLDVGANIGIWSRELLARRRPATLVAFEPELRNFQLLTRNLSPYPNASCERLAIGARDGTVRLSEDLDSGQTTW